MRAQPRLLMRASFRQHLLRVEFAVFDIAFMPARHADMPPPLRAMLISRCLCTFHHADADIDISISF